MKMNEFSRYIRYELTQSIYAKHDSFSRNNEMYWQGRIDQCNELLALLGYDRINQSDEMMLVQRRVTANSVQHILSKKTSKPPPTVYN